MLGERKTTCDLYSSIRDGRYKEQKCRLLNNYDKRKILYIIELHLLTKSECMFLVEQLVILAQF